MSTARSTKIVATLGPASSDAGVLERMFLAGVDVVRLNFSHGTAADHIKRAELVRETCRKVGRAVGIMADLQGPKIRVGKFKDGKIMLKAGQPFVLDAAIELGDATHVGLDYKELPRDVKAGDVLLLDDGKLVLDVVSVRGSEIHTVTRHGGTLSNNKGINRQGGGLTAPALTPKDIDDIRTAAQMKVDYLAVSFPKSGADMYMARELLRAAGGHAMLIAKIERAEAIPALEDIMQACDGIMVARGDLAVEVGDATVPALQKRMIRQARELNKLTITATQMMESMISSPVPTRAEVSDVANAVLDGTDAVMLSAESASGQYPVETIAAMNRICIEAEKSQPVTLENEFLNRVFTARRPVDRDGGALHRVSPEGEGDRRPHRVGLDGAVDVAAELRRADLRPHLADIHALPLHAFPRHLPADGEVRGPRPRGAARRGRGGARGQRRREARRPHRAHHRRADRQVGRHQHDEDREGGRKPPPAIDLG